MTRHGPQTPGDCAGRECWPAGGSPSLRMHLLVEGLFWTHRRRCWSPPPSLALDRLLRFNLPTRLGLLAIALVAVAGAGGAPAGASAAAAAWTISIWPNCWIAARAGVGQQISNVLQLPELLASEHYASPSMVHAAVDRVLRSAGRRGSDGDAQRRAAAQAAGRLRRGGCCWRSGFARCGPPRPSCGPPLVGRLERALAASTRI